jgi:glycosyltransferase involved in cell wall biosynthesis
MKVLVMPADLAGCGFYRLIWAAEYLQTEGHDIKILYPGHDENSLDIHFIGDVRDDPNAEILDVVMPYEADVLVTQRVSHNWHCKVMDVLRKKGVACVIDMDDDLSSMHPENQAYRNFQPRNTATPFSWKNVEATCKAATLVTVSTKSLINVYARHGRGHVIDNYVPERYLRVEAPMDEVFGWPGTTQSHPNDLQTLGQAVNDLVRDGYEFRVIGPRSKVKLALRMSEEPNYTGVISMTNWASEIARLRVAMAPLAPTQFNTSKSRLKLIEASAVGVPWVASPRAEYRRFHAESGAGILAEKPKEWYKAIKQLMDDESLRKDLGEQGREYMRGQTVEANAWRHLEAWQRAYDIQNGRAK